MPYATLNEVYGSGFGKADPNKLAQNFGMRNVEDFKQRGVPDSALPVEVGTSNRDIVRFNQRRQGESGDDIARSTALAENREGGGLREPNYRYTTLNPIDDASEIEDVYEGFSAGGMGERRRVRGGGGGGSLHERFLEHFGNCPTCRQKVWEKFSDYVEKRGGDGAEGGSDIREMFGSGDVMKSAEKPSLPVVKDGQEGGSGSGGADSYVDVIVMILLGVFIIFVLDAFVKLGRGLTPSVSE